MFVQHQLHLSSAGACPLTSVKIFRRPFIHQRCRHGINARCAMTFNGPDGRRTFDQVQVQCALAAHVMSNPDMHKVNVIPVLKYLWQDTWAKQGSSARMVLGLCIHAIKQAL